MTLFKINFTLSRNPAQVFYILKALHFVFGNFFNLIYATNNWNYEIRDIGMWKGLYKIVFVLLQIKQYNYHLKTND